MNSVAIIIPIFNEQNTILKIAKSISKYGTLVCINDGSTDNSANILQENGFFVKSHIKNLGYEAALNTGFIEASKLKFDIVVTMDADGQHNPFLVEGFIDKIKEGCDVALGIRSEIPRFSEKLFAFYSRTRFNIVDPCCGLKAYRMSVFMDKGSFDKYKTIGTELAFFSVHNRYKIGQLPFNVENRHDESRFGNKIQANTKILLAIVRSIVNNSKIINKRITKIK